MGILFSHAAHPVIIHGSSRLISGDFPAYAIRHLRARFGDNVSAMFAQACGAQINGEPLRGGFDATETAGTALADAAYRAACESTPIKSGKLTVNSIQAHIPLAPLPTRDECAHVLQEARARLAAVLAKRPNLFG